jgi:hypothetical protein
VGIPAHSSPLLSHPSARSGPDRRFPLNSVPPPGLTHTYRTCYIKASQSVALPGTECYLTGHSRWKLPGKWVEAQQSFRLYKVRRVPEFVTSLYRPSSAPRTWFPSWAFQNRVSLHMYKVPFSPKQKFATPPPMRILPRSTPPGFHTFTPSPQPLYTLPWVSHLMPSGQPDSANANRRRLARDGPRSQR